MYIRPERSFYAITNITVDNKKVIAIKTDSKNSVHLVTYNMYDIKFILY